MFFFQNENSVVCSMLGYLAWPFTILQNDNITISWDFSQADSTSSHAGTPWCWQSEKNLMIIVILSFCDIVNGQAKYSPHHVRAATDNFSQLTWPLTILQNDSITISWDFFQADSTKVAAGAVSLRKSHYIVILSFCNIIKGQANY